MLTFVDADGGHYITFRIVISDHNSYTKLPSVVTIVQVQDFAFGLQLFSQNGKSIVMSNPLIPPTVLDHDIMTNSVCELVDFSCPNDFHHTILCRYVHLVMFVHVLHNCVASNFKQLQTIMSGQTEKMHNTTKLPINEKNTITPHKLKEIKKCNDYRVGIMNFKLSYNTSFTSTENQYYKFL